MQFDYGELDNLLRGHGVGRHCIVCGSEELDDSGRGFLLVEVPEDGNLDLAARASGLFCGARVCNTCGYVHIFAEAPVRS